MNLPDYVLSEVEDRGRVRRVIPSSISPWAEGTSMMASLTVSQCDELRRLGRDPAATAWAEGVNWMWVTVPLPAGDQFEGFDRRSYGRAVQKLACPIIRNIGTRIQVLTPKGRLQNIYPGGRLSPPREQKPRRVGMGR